MANEHKELKENKLRARAIILPKVVLHLYHIHLE